MMDASEINRIHISQAAYHHLVADNRFLIDNHDPTKVNRNEIFQYSFAFLNHAG